MAKDHQSPNSIGLRLSDKREPLSYSPSANFSSQVTVSASLQTSLPTDFSYMNGLSSNAPKKVYLNQILSHPLPFDEKVLKTDEIRKMAMNKSIWSKNFAVSMKKKPSDLSTKLQ